MDPIQQIVDSFEDQWFIGKRPDLADFLPRVPADQRPTLLLQLLRVAVEYRQKAGENVLPSEYRQHGTDAEDEVARLTNRPTRHQPRPLDPVDAGTQIGDYRLIEPLGEGGMGTVYRAVQTREVRREVALKIVKSGLDSREVINRFEAERQALAMMDHPNIATILDAGTTEEGSPYFVMELVQGIPLTHYCDLNSLGIADRLAIFCQVCHAVQHAHQKGVIHRDLKPSNILVGEYDGVPVPKVIDFGLAKALDASQKLTDKSVFTEFGQVLGTLKYMSPEQAGLSSLDIDTRSDVYALGIILYELLTGKTPLDDDSLQGKALLKILELVREQESPKPSSQLSTTRKELIETITRVRRTDARRLGQILVGDLDWIVMKALDKDRQRRYSTAAGFAEDVRRYLEGEAVEARPPTLAYRLRKFVRRNYKFVTAVAVTIALLIAGATSTTMFALKAQDSAHQAESILKIVTDSFQTVNPTEGADSTMMAKDVLVNALAILDKSDLSEEGRRILLEKLSECFQGLGEYDLAMSASQQSVDLASQSFDEAEEAVSISNLANSKLAVGEVDQALELYQSALESNRRRYGDNHPTTIASTHVLANAYRQAGDLQKAIPLLEETLAAGRKHLGEKHPHCITYLNNLALAYRDAGRLQEAADSLQQALTWIQAEMGEDHPNALTTMDLLGMTHYALGDFSKAQTMLEESLRLSVGKLGPTHPSTLITRINLASVFDATGHTEDSIRMLEEIVPLCRDEMGENHQHTLAAKLKLVQGYHRLGDSSRALPMGEELFEQFQRQLGPAHAKTMVAANLLATLYTSADRPEDALPILQEALESCRQNLGDKHSYTLAIMVNLAAAHRALQNDQEALRLTAEALEGFQTTLGDEHPKTIGVMGVLGRAYVDNGRVEEGVSLLEDTVRTRKRTSGEQHPHTWIAMRELAYGLEMQGQLDRAKVQLEECLTLMIQHSSVPWDAPATKIQLGGVLLKMKRFDEASVPLRDGYRELRDLAESIPPATRKTQLKNALRKLIEFAEATERNDAIPKLQEKLDRLESDGRGP